MSETSGSSGEQNKKAPLHIEMNETQLMCLPQVESFREILAELAVHGLDSPGNLLFCGTEGGELLKTGTQGDRRTTYALPTVEYARQAVLADTHGADYSGTPLEIAHRDSDEQPILAVYNANLLKSGVDHEEVQYETIEGTTLDDALVAIIKLV